MTKKWFKEKKEKLEEKPFGTRPVISNIVASGRFPKAIDIEGVYKKVKFVQAEYEPETYPALLVKVMIDGNRRHVTLYKNGKYIITGAKSQEELDKIYDTIIELLKKNKFL